MITFCSCWYSVRIINWPCINNMLIYSDYLMITCCSCWYSVRIISWPCVDIQWLSDIQSESWIDHVLIICWYIVIIWWLSAVLADIQSVSSVDHMLIYSDYLIFSQKHQLTMCWYTVIILYSARFSFWWLPAVPHDIQSGSLVGLVQGVSKKGNIAIFC